MDLHQLSLTSTSQRLSVILQLLVRNLRDLLIHTSQIDHLTQLHSLVQHLLEPNGQSPVYSALLTSIELSNFHIALKKVFDPAVVRMDRDMVAERIIVVKITHLVSSHLPELRTTMSLCRVAKTTHQPSKANQTLVA